MELHYPPPATTDIANKIAACYPEPYDIQQYQLPPAARRAAHAMAACALASHNRWQEPWNCSDAPFWPIYNALQTTAPQPPSKV